MKSRIVKFNGRSEDKEWMLIVKTSRKVDLIGLMKSRLPQKYGGKLHSILTVRDGEWIWKIYVKGEDLLSRSLSLLDEFGGIMEVKVGYRRTIHIPWFNFQANIEVIGDQAFICPWRILEVMFNSIFNILGELDKAFAYHLGRVFVREFFRRSREICKVPIESKIKIVIGMLSELNLVDHVIFGGNGVQIELKKVDLSFKGRELAKYFIEGMFNELLSHDNLNEIIKLKVK